MIMIFIGLVIGFITGWVIAKYFAHTHEWELYDEKAINTVDVETGNIVRQRIIHVYKCKKCGKLKEEQAYIC